jgi:hypothetical protein
MEKQKFVSICTGAEVTKKEMRTRVFSVDWDGNLYEFDFEACVWEVLNIPQENYEVNID